MSAGQSYRNGTEQYPELFEVKRADILAQSSFLQQEKLLYVDRYEHMYQQIMEKEQCLSLKELAVNGLGSDCPRCSARKRDRRNSASDAGESSGRTGIE